MVEFWTQEEPPRGRHELRRGAQHSNNCWIVSALALPIVTNKDDTTIRPSKIPGII
jgi:hypothetical protein